MPRPRRLASPRGIRAAPLVTVPVLLALAAPASAAPAAAVTPATEGCGVVVALTGLADGPHTAVVRTTVLSSGDAVPVVLPPDPDAPAGAQPPVTAERRVTGDGRLVVVLDAAAVPDADPRVAVTVTLDGDASPAVELALPGCAAPPVTPKPTPTPTPTVVPSTPSTTPPTSPPTSGPTSGPSTEPTTAPSVSVPPTSEPTTAPAPVPPAAEAPVQPPTALPGAPAPSAPAPATPAAPAASPSSPASPSASPTPTVSPRPSGAPAPSAGPVLRPVTLSPVLTGASVPSPVPTLEQTLAQAYGAYDLGSGTSDYLSLMSFTAAPQLDVAAAPQAVPAPVIAAPEGSAAGVLAGSSATGGSLDDVLPQTPDHDGDDDPTAQLAAPDLATDTAADPLVDLAPAAFVLSASLGGLLMAGRRRTS